MFIKETLKGGLTNMLVSSLSAPELLAKYCDQVLKKVPRFEPGFENKLSRTIIVFKYLDDKDLFQKSYSKLFAKRLIHGSYQSLENEETMITMLKQVSVAAKDRLCSCFYNR